MYEVEHDCAAAPAACFADYFAVAVVAAAAAIAGYYGCLMTAQ